MKKQLEMKRKMSKGNALANVIKGMPKSKNSMPASRPLHLKPFKTQDDA
jgi:hypothetical protein